MRLPIFYEVVLVPIGCKPAIKIGIRQQILRSINARFEKKLIVARESQVMFPNVVESSFTAKVTAGFIRRGDLERTLKTINGRYRFSGGRIVRNGNPGTFAKRNGVVPLARMIGCQMSTPFVAG